ncbi:high affinity copper uptake protein 1 [Drosophila subobscura]|uniref:high affinity copper uptake protein 1 n=1 Tax=Drosophila subobscura TaxID=7241 RepID=UPI00155B01C4|nr:high affinity copper uptake protein 1 [Drosophila subobscura]
MDMDHNHDHETDDSTSAAKSCPMIMVFHAGHCERILWRGWVAATVTEFVLSAIAIFVVSFLYEALKFLRQHLARRVARKEAERLADEQRRKSDNPSGSDTPLAEPRELSYGQRLLDSSHIIQSLLNLLQIVISYLLMLIFMTFNYWLCLAVVLGLGIGYFFFGWNKKTPDESECCP